MLRSGTIEPRQWELGLWNELDNEIPDHALFDPRPLAILQEWLKDPHGSRSQRARTLQLPTGLAQHARCIVGRVATPCHNLVGPVKARSLY
jgi:hypothetical protein